MINLDDIRAQFPLLSQEANGFPLAYLDNAATSHKPKVVLDSVYEFYAHDNANVHRGLYELSRRATERYEESRRIAAGFLNARDPSEVVWVRGATEGINLVASSWGWDHLHEGDEVLLTVLEHHSNVVPWQLITRRTGAKIRYIDIDDEGRLDLESFEKLLSEKTKLVALGHVSNALGTIHPVADIVRRAHAAGAKVLIDGAQGAPHLKIDVQALDCDFYVLSGHKMCAPMGIGVLWARRELLEEMAPYHGGGEMIDRVFDDYSTYAEVPHKFEAGTPNAGGAVGLAAAMQFLESIGHDALWEHEQMLTRYGMDALAKVKGLRMFGPRNIKERTAVFSFEIEGVHPHDIATVLDSQGIAIRAGHHCAQPLMRRLCVPATTRASCYLYNTTEEIDRLVAGLDMARDLFGT